MMQIAPWPQLEDDEIDAVVQVLKSGKTNYWTGTEVKQFEQEFARYCDSDYGVAVANGSLGLDLALRAVDIGPGDEVIVSPRSFFASAGAIALLGATPVFADVDRESQNITADSIKHVLSPRTKAVICVHLSGWPCDMEAILRVVADRDIAIIEDCAQAHGARINDRPVGSWGAIGVFSFCQDKIMSTGGEGGMVVTSDEALWKRMWSFKDHGKGYDVVHADNHPDGFRWLHESFGSNYRLTEMQAAIGRRQLTKLDDWVARRRQNAAILDTALSIFKCIRITAPPANVFHSYYKHYVFVEPENLRSDWDRDRVLQAISAHGIPGLSGSCPEIYLERAFSGPDLPPEQRLPVARELGETSIQFLVHPTLKAADMRAMADAIANVLGEAQDVQ
jgi:dTDP-4-amino-4,6-dideoxygalactose transaminase